MEARRPARQFRAKGNYRLQEKDKAANVMNPVFLAQSKLRRRRFDECIALCDQALAIQPLDRHAWFLKTRALTLKNELLDIDLEEEGLAEMMLDENAMAKAPRPGTSMRLGTSSNNPSVRPLTSSGRPLSGYVRPSTQSRGNFDSRPTTSRPLTSTSGRGLRLGTASMIQRGDKFIDPDRIDFKKRAQMPAESKALMDYLLVVEKNPTKALELAAEATKFNQYGDWWWKSRLGRCYYQLGMLRDAESQFKSANKMQEMVATYLELAKVYLRYDQPNAALDVYASAAEKFPGDTTLTLGAARVFEAINDTARSVQFFKKVLHFDACNVEAIASLGSHHFYNDQPELALRFYRRLLQLGVSNPELWNNMGLCCFYACQYDLALTCFERAMHTATDNEMPDIWYNLGQIAITIGDLNLAYQCLKLAITVDDKHAEAWNNLAVLELRKNNVDVAKSSFITAQELGPHMYEPFFNAALIAYKLGDCQESYDNASKALKVYPDHSDSKELIKQLKRHFAML